MSNVRCPTLEFHRIGKVFPGVAALEDISFTCHPRAIHALMGENGAGKSTLLKILSGNYLPSSGELRIDGKAVRFQSTIDALKQGIAVIYQELHLVPEISVAENIYIGQLPQRYGMIDWPILYENAQRQLDHLGVDIDPCALLKSLSIGQRQMVEIAKALTRKAQIIAFDEPTSSLSSREITQLFRVIRELKGEGRVIIYVSHRMEEIFLLCDQITVFKDGRYVKTFPQAKEVNNDELVRAMVGRDVGDIYGYEPRTLGKIRLDVENFMAPGLSLPANFVVRQGEIVGFFGLVGAGRSELMKALFGACQVPKAISGSVSIDGCLARIRSPIDAISQGMVLCPEDRKADGVIGVHSVRDNINLSARRNTLVGGFLINAPWERKNAQAQIESLNIKTPSDQQTLNNLSGGNQQKAILGRWLSENVKIILLDEPTRGIDVGAKNEIYTLIYTLAAQGVAVLFVSSDLPEVLGVVDRVLVMREGAIVGELARAVATEEKTLQLAMIREAALPSTENGGSCCHV